MYKSLQPSSASLALFLLHFSHIFLKRSTLHTMSIKISLLRSDGYLRLIVRLYDTWITVMCHCMYHWSNFRMFHPKAFPLKEKWKKMVCCMCSIPCKCHFHYDLHQKMAIKVYKRFCFLYAWQHLGCMQTSLITSLFWSLFGQAFVGRWLMKIIINESVIKRWQ